MLTGGQLGHRLRCGRQRGTLLTFEGCRFKLALAIQNELGSFKLCDLGFFLFLLFSTRHLIMKIERNHLGKKVEEVTCAYSAK